MCPLFKPNLQGVTLCYIITPKLPISVLDHKQPGRVSPLFRQHFADWGAQFSLRAYSPEGQWGFYLAYFGRLCGERPGMWCRVQPHETHLRPCERRLHDGGDISVLWGVDINCSAGISPVFSLEWWRKGVICKARAPLREWQPQSISDSFTQIRETTAEVKWREKEGEQGRFSISFPLCRLITEQGGHQSLTSHSC